MSRTRTVAALTAAGLALGAGPTVATALAADRTVRATGPTAVHAAPFEATTADVHAVTTGSGRTIVTLHLSGLPAAVRGTTLGAHVHTGACGTAPAASGPHHANPSAPPGTPLVDREIWLDVDVNGAGNARSHAVADWVIAPGAARSVVLHAAPTDPVSGAAGARLLCVDVPFGLTS